MSQKTSATPSLSSLSEMNKEAVHEKAQNGNLSPVKSAEANILPEVESNLPGEDVEKVPSRKGPPGGMLDPSSFPDGGAKAWLCVLGGFCCLFCSFGWINGESSLIPFSPLKAGHADPRAAIGVFQEYYQTQLLSNYSPSAVSWIPSLETFFMFFGGPVVGKLYDNFGPRYVLLTGTFLHVFGLMMTSLSTQYYQILLAQGICSPIGASFIFYPAMSTIISWFFRRRALALGIMTAGSSLGGVIFPIMVQNLIPKIGFPWTMRVSAFLILGLLTIANLTVRSRIPPSPRPFSIMDFIRPLKEPAFATLGLAAFVVFLGFFIPFNFVTLSALSLGMDKNLSNYLLAILNATSIFGRILPGWAADKLGRYNVQIVMCALCAILDLAIWLPARGNAPIIVFAALYGFTSGAFVSVTPAIIAQISDIKEIGTRTGSLFAVVSVAALVGNPIGGALLGEGGYTAVQIYTGVVIIAGAALFVVSKALCKDKLFKKF